jgi:hypothetical protein
MLLQKNFCMEVLPTSAARELMRVLLVMKLQMVFICSTIITDVTVEHFLHTMTLPVFHHLL